MGVVDIFGDVRAISDYSSGTSKAGLSRLTTGNPGLRGPPPDGGWPAFGVANGDGQASTGGAEDRKGRQGRKAKVIRRKTSQLTPGGRAQASRRKALILISRALRRHDERFIEEHR